MRRGYDLPVFDDAVRRLRAAGLEVIVHQILGLPGETDAQMVQTARYIGQSGAQGIKLHLPHVLRGTDLAADYAAGSSRCSRRSTISTCSSSVCAYSHRRWSSTACTGDGAKRDLIAPLASADKKRVLNAI
ncbi:MAG: TIGR01212 family radical SAM protein, partial [Oscillospiraceae bacterium]